MAAVPAGGGRPATALPTPSAAQGDSTTTVARRAISTASGGAGGAPRGSTRGVRRIYVTLPKGLCSKLETSLSEKEFELFFGSLPENEFGEKDLTLVKKTFLAYASQFNWLEGRSSVPSIPRLVEKMQETFNTSYIECYIALIEQNNLGDYLSLEFPEGSSDSAKVDFIRTELSHINWKSVRGLKLKGLSILPPEILKMVSPLEGLNVSEGSLITLPKECASLRGIYANNNNLIYVPDLRNADWVDLRNNKLETPPKIRFSHDASNKYVDLSNNSIHIFPENIFENMDKFPKNLILKNNPLESFRHRFSMRGYRKTEYVNISDSGRLCKEIPFNHFLQELLSHTIYAEPTFSRGLYQMGLAIDKDQSTHPVFKRAIEAYNARYYFADKKIPYDPEGLPSDGEAIPLFPKTFAASFVNALTMSK